MSREIDAMNRHPAAVAVDEFRKENAKSYSMDGLGESDPYLKNLYLKNRLDRAFQAGWDACAAAALRAVGGEGGKHG